MATVRPAYACVPGSSRAGTRAIPTARSSSGLQPGTFVFDVCRLVASLVIRGLLPDPTGGATHYHTKGVAPDWSRGKMPSAVIGDHLFFNDID